MSDAADQARELLADPPIGVEVWGPIVEGLLAELSEMTMSRAELADEARNVIEQARAHFRNSVPLMLPDEAIRFHETLARILDEAERGEGL